MFFLSILLAASFVPTAARACAILPPDQHDAFALQVVADFKTAATTVAGQADTIFVGRMATLADAPATQAGPSGRARAPQQHTATFDRSYAIKGHYTDGQPLSFTLDSNRVTVPMGCRPVFWQLPRQNGAGESYLVYVADGKILRTNLVPKEPQAMNGADGAAFLSTPK